MNSMNNAAGLAATAADLATLATTGLDLPTVMGSGNGIDSQVAPPADELLAEPPIADAIEALLTKQAGKKKAIGIPAAKPLLDAIASVLTDKANSIGRQAKQATRDGLTIVKNRVEALAKQARAECDSDRDQPARRTGFDYCNCDATSNFQ